MSRSQSILFVLGRWSIGGVERVSVVLANEFARRGCDVAVAAFGFDNKRLLENLDARVAVIELSDGWYTEANRRRLRSAVEERKVAVIINQWCLPFRTTRFLRKAVKGLGVRIVAVHHNKPDVNNRICGAGNVFARTFWRIVSRVNLHLVYGSCDAYVLLSKSFEDVFCRFACIRDRDKLHCISNPLTIAPVDAGAKENILLYVGRLEETQKKVSRLLEAWSVLARDFPDWRLAIVGDGPDRSFYEGMARTLARVEFY
ncbi:MAG: glycosyltransferase [Kiritimatiellae bacterium]|nr:glycosyltransferase [Kiritimatiellia bacterium]